jgi:hypothetical protein
MNFFNDFCFRHFKSSQLNHPYKLKPIPACQRRSGWDFEKQ